jgi:hypothetical protein
MLRTGGNRYEDAMVLDDRASHDAWHVPTRIAHRAAVKHPDVLRQEAEWRTIRRAYRYLPIPESNPGWWTLTNG